MQILQKKYLPETDLQLDQGYETHSECKEDMQRDFCGESSYLALPRAEHLGEIPPSNFRLRDL